MTGGGVTTLAVVMTYNRMDRLRRCLMGVQGQTVPPTGVLVLDNGSTDGTAAVLRTEFPEIRVHETGENTGSAGAIREALRVAMESGPDYIWFLDDDVFPFPECLETLLREMQSLEADVPVGALRPMVRDPDTGKRGGGATTHGALLSGNMVRQVGLPRADTFMEMSDHAYNAMMRQHGYMTLRVPYLLGEHTVRNGKLLRAVVRDGFTVTPWRLYYAVRNRVWHSLYAERSVARFLRTLSLALRTLVLLTLFGRPRRGHLMVVRGVLDGVRGQLGRRVEPQR